MRTPAGTRSTASTPVGCVPPGSVSEDSGGARRVRGGRSGVDAELAVDALRVGSERVHRHVEFGCDLSRSEASREVLEHGELAFAEYYSAEQRDVLRRSCRDRA